MRNVTDRVSNPFGMRPDCDRFVPGYGDANADFHVVGDHPGVHGGADTGVPFTNEAGLRLQRALVEAGLLRSAGERPAVERTFLSYLHTCVAESDPSPAAYADMERFFDAELRAIAAHPGVHGGLDTGVPFTGTAAGGRLLDALVDAGLLVSAGDAPEVASTYLSYLHMCAPEGHRLDGDGSPTAASYDDMERFFDAELRAIAAHVLLPVGARATRHVLESYTAQAHKTAIDMDALHGREIRGSGWLVLPIKDPAEWAPAADDRLGDAERLVDAVATLRSTDYRRESDLGRFIAGSDPYMVR